MRQEVFQSGILRRVVLPVFIAAIMMVVLIGVKDIPNFFLFFFIIPIGIFVYEHRSKIIIEEGILTSQHGFIFLKGEEAPLNKVTQIVSRQVETWEEDSDGDSRRVTKKIIYVLDTHGRTFYSFPAHLVGKKHIKRFEEAVNAANPNVDVDLN